MTWVDAVETRTKEELRKVFPFKEGDIIGLKQEFRFTKYQPTTVVHYDKDGNGNFHTFDLDGDCYDILGHENQKENL